MPVPEKMQLVAARDCISAAEAEVCTALNRRPLSRYLGITGSILICSTRAGLVFSRVLATRAQSISLRAALVPASKEARLAVSVYTRDFRRQFNSKVTAS